MKIKLLFLLLLLVVNCVFAQRSHGTPTCNYMQIDGLLYDYQSILGDTTGTSGDTSQIFTGRPAISFCFQAENINIRPNIILNPYNSSTEGSFLIGNEYEQKFEIGLFTSFNRSQRTLGKNETKNEIIETNLLIGPYAIIFPAISENYFTELFFKVTYEYDDQRITTNGSSTLVLERKGVNISTRFLYGKKLSEHLFFTPNIILLYSYTSDTVGSIGRSLTEVQLLPLSFRWEL